MQIENLTVRFYFKAPENFTMVDVSTRSIRISVMPALDSPGVTHYVAVVEGNSSSNSSCIMAAAVSAMECELTDLVEDTEYTIMTRACVVNEEVDICGEGVELTTRTLAQGEFITTHIYAFTNRE